jgi:hypothetical protein
MVKTQEEQKKKCDEIIDSLKDFSILEKYLVVKTLWLSLNDCLSEEQILIFEIESKFDKE